MSDYEASNGVMTVKCNKLKMVWKKADVTSARYYPGIILEVLRNITKTSVVSNGLPPEYKYTVRELH
jgi:hypothetical protein